jgi:hypothetical protein
MANINTINIGNQVNDGLGDDLRTAFQKVNGNFTALNNELTITASNVGTGEAVIFKEKVGTDLRFRSLAAGPKIVIEENTDSIRIYSNAPDAFTRIDTDSGTSVLASFGQQISIEGTPASGATTNRNDIEVIGNGSKIQIRTKLPVSDILTIYDFGPITGNYNNIMQMSMNSANVDFGTISLPGRLDLDCGFIV